MIFLKISVLTSTYNREKYLTRLYKSIVDNLNQNLIVEWIVIDDGSEDNTQILIKKFILEDKIDIKYIYQKNNGKMNAINKGVELASGDILIDCDSDDFFAKNAFDIIYKNVNKLFLDNNLYGLCFLKKKLNGEISGKKFKRDFMISKMFDLYFKYDIKGEKILVFNTEIRKRYKHILENGEKFITEARMYHMMDNHYNVLCINEVIQIGDYLENGYTKKYEQIMRNNPIGYYKYFKEIINFGFEKIRFRKKLYILKNYVKFFFMAKRKK